MTTPIQLQSFVAYGESNGKVGGAVRTGKGSVGKGWCWRLAAPSSTGHDLEKNHGIWQHAPSLEVAAPLFQPTARPQWKGVVYHQSVCNDIFWCHWAQQKNCKTVKHLNQPNKQKACRRRWNNTWDLLASVWSGLTPSSQILHTPQTPRWWNVIISVHKKVKKHTVSCRIFSSTQLTKYCSSLPCFQIFLWFFVGPYLDHPS